MSSLLDLVVNFVRINHLTHAPLAVLKYANLQAPLLLQNVLLVQRHWTMDLLECCDIVESFVRADEHERQRESRPVAPLSIQCSQQPFVLTQVVQQKFFVYSSLNSAAACVVLARLNTVLLLIGIDGDPLLETQLGKITDFVNSIS
jgi:hypothetical protein